MNIQKAERFISEYKLPVCIVLTVIMLCCFAVTIADGLRAVPVSAGESFIAADGADGDIIQGREDAMEFGRICIDNRYPGISDSAFYISDSGGVYTVYQDRADTYFDEYYKIYPYAAITPGGRVFVSICRKF